MADLAEQVPRVANAYRAALNQGDHELAGSSLDTKILQAMVAQSAADCVQWIQTRVADGTTVAKPLEELVPLLEKDNTVGKGLRAAQTRLVADAKSLVYAALGISAWPVWAASALALVMGALLFAQDAGTQTGAVFWKALLGGGAVVGATVRAVQNAGKMGEAANAAVDASFASAERIGSRAQKVFNESAVPVLKEAGIPVPVTDPVLAKLRGGAKAVLVATYGFLAACGLFFAIGFLNALSTTGTTLS